MRPARKVGALRSRMSSDRHASQPAVAANFSADALRRLLLTTQVTTARTFIGGDRSADDYRASIFVYLERYIEKGEIPDLAKAVLKAVSLRTWLLEHPEARPPR